MRCARSGLALTLVCAGACVGPGLLSDGSSVSVGNTSTGSLRSGATLPIRGEGYYVPRRWQARQRTYATDELVGLLVRTARRVNRSYRNSLLSVADLSPRGGGATPEHRSHRSGRDVDIVLYHLDLDGRPVPAEEMINFDDDGASLPPTSQPASQPSAANGSKLPAGGPPSPEEAPPTLGTGARGVPRTPAPEARSAPLAASASPQTAPAVIAPPARKLDVDRTWGLVKALVTDPQTSVQWLFVGRPIARLLLLHAKRKGEPTYIIERAAAIMHHAHAHMDHMHIRVFCAPSDRALGCVDRGPARWLKKEIKYQHLDLSPLEQAELPEGLARLSLRPLYLLGL